MEEFLTKHLGKDSDITAGTAGNLSLGVGSGGRFYILLATGYAGGSRDLLKGGWIQCHFARPMLANFR